MIVTLHLLLNFPSFLIEAEYDTFYLLYLLANGEDSIS